MRLERCPLWPSVRKNETPLVCSSATAGGRYRMGGGRYTMAGGRYTIMCAFVSCIALMGVAGCAPRLPVYPWSGHEDALRTITARARSIDTVSARCRMVLSGSDGETIQLDGAIVVKYPDHFRLRAWKFSRCVFDLTVTPEGVWLMDAEGDRRGDLADLLSPTNSPTRVPIMTAWSLVQDPSALGGEPELIDMDERRFTVRYASDDGYMQCRIDRRTLTPIEYRFMGADGRTAATIKLDAYRARRGAVWPTRMTIRSEERMIELRLSEIEINDELAERAFDPPTGAIRQP